VANGINQVCTSKRAQGHALQAALEAGGVEFIEETAGAWRTTAKAAALRNSVIGIAEAGNIVLALAAKHDMNSDLLRPSLDDPIVLCTGLFFSF
jgi:hypothetical protein